MIGRLRKQQNGLGKIVLALFIAGCLNLVIQSGLMAATLNDCHDSRIQAPAADQLQDDSGYLDANCTHCPYNDPASEDSGYSSLYLCASMAACNDEGQQPAIDTAELNMKPWVNSGSTLWQDAAELPAYRYHGKPTIHARSPSLNVHYCRFLI
jgi:hypothetical protein